MSKKARRRPKWKKPKNPVTSRVFDRLLKEAGDRLFADLLAKQEPLGEEFEKVLYDNLWDLYEKD